MRIYEYILKGKPMACPRPRSTRQGKIYMPKEYNKHKKAITADLISQFVIQGHSKIVDPVQVEIVFIYPRPKYLGGDDLRLKDTKPDIDNIIKTVLDGITNAGIWTDDNIVVGLNCTKYYGPRDFIGQTEIKISWPWEVRHD